MRYRPQHVDVGPFVAELQDITALALQEDDSKVAVLDDGRVDPFHRVVSRNSQTRVFRHLSHWTTTGYINLDTVTSPHREQRLDIGNIGRNLPAGTRAGESLLCTYETGHFDTEARLKFELRQMLRRGVFRRRFGVSQK